MYRRIIKHMQAGLSALLLLFPAVGLAYGSSANGTAVAQAKDFLNKLNTAIVFPLISLMMAIALLVFLYGAFEYVRGASNETQRETGRRHLLWGIVGLVIMLSALAILNIAAATFGLQDSLSGASSDTHFGSGGFLVPSNNGYTDLSSSRTNTEAQFGSGAQNYNQRPTTHTINQQSGDSFATPGQGASGYIANTSPTANNTTNTINQQSGDSFATPGQGASANITDTPPTTSNAADTINQQTADNYVTPGQGASSDIANTAPHVDTTQQENQFTVGVEDGRYALYMQQVNDVGFPSYITQDSIVGYMELKTADITPSISGFQQHILPQCQNMGGTDIVSVNVGWGRDFFCVDINRTVDKTVVDQQHTQASSTKQNGWLWGLIPSLF